MNEATDFKFDTHVSKLVSVFPNFTSMLNKINVITSDIHYVRNAKIVFRL